MLLELKVKDLGIIQDINWKLDSGLNVITGETGAGKSLVIEAVELLLVGSAGEDLIRTGAAEARIEGVFALSSDSKYAPLKAASAEKGLVEKETLVINYDIRRQKPGVVRINGRTVTKSVLRQMGQLLIDIHGQSEHLSLLDKRYHLDFLDSYAHILEQRNEFLSRLSKYRELDAEIKALQDKESSSARQEEFLKYQIDEIKRAKLRPGEDEEMDKERHIISFSEKLKEYSSNIYRSLYAGDSSRFSAPALARLNEAIVSLRKLVELDPAFKPHLDILEKSLYSIEEVARDVRTYNDNLVHDPSRLEEIESRLELIRNLKRKYGKTIPDILSFLENSQKELSNLSLSSERRSQLEKEIAELKSRLGKLAFDLSEKRNRAARELTTKVLKELQDLEMSQMQFAVSVTQKPSEEGIPGADGKNYVYGNEGVDDVEFMVSTNPGEPLKPLARIASTGEISRFTLALKGALSEADNIPVLIFDEVDIGIGGRSGDIVGKKLWALAQNHQVICVTHLPQIAVYAGSHYCVQKAASGERTTSLLQVLTGDARINELATMLAGPGYSETARQNALELASKVDKWKKEK